MNLLEGRAVADKILASVKKNIIEEKLKPSLAVILVGADPASEIYVNLKGKAANEIGIGFDLIKFSVDAQEEEVLEKIKTLNKDTTVSGIIVQLPLPEKFNTQKIIDAIDAQKDVDGFSSTDLNPVFPQAIMKLLESAETQLIASLQNKKAIVVANSEKFGSVMVAELAKKDIAGSYILCKELQSNSLREADIVITACGLPGKITGDMLNSGAIVIDGGITKKGEKTLGDVDFASVSQVAGYLSPVPGGVGPVTIACLLENVYLAAKKQH